MGRFSALDNCPLFADVSAFEIGAMLKCLGATEKKYKKNEYIWNAEDSVSQVGVVMEGSVNIIKEDFWGNRSILARATEGELFGEAFACGEIERLPLSVVATEDCRVIFFDYGKIITVCDKGCEFHRKLTDNMLKVLAGKNVMLTAKMEHMSKRTTREKLLSYLSQQAIARGKQTFEIPFNRQELADYLSVDRSAMSMALSKLKEEGLIDYTKNKFTLL